MAEKTLKNIYVYRMTHIDNIPHILKNGITHKESENCNPDFISIGDRSLISNRSTKEVDVDNGDYTAEDIESIILGNFIPFYFGVKMPMLYVVQHGGNFVEKATKPEEIVYMACSLESIVNSGVSFYFTDGHATDNLTTFYDSDSVSKLPNIINWQAITTSYWGGHENLNLKRKKQAELLVSSDLPVTVIKKYACYNDKAKIKLTGFGIPEEVIKVYPQAYY